MWLDKYGRVKVRLQDEFNSFELRSETKIEAGDETTVALAFDQDTISLFVNGVLESSAEGAFRSMAGNSEDAVNAASTRKRRDDDDRLEWFFTGLIAEVALIVRAITAPEAALLAGAGGILAHSCPISASPTPQQTCRS